MRHAEDSNAPASVPSSWDVYNALEGVLRNYFEDTVPFDLEVNESEDGFTAAIVLDRQPDSDTLSLGTRLEERLAAQGGSVRIEFRQGRPSGSSKREYDAAKAEFSRVWRQLSPKLPAEAESSAMVSLPVREFIYLDVEQLSSLFAQSKQGLTTLISLYRKGSTGGSWQGNQGTSTAFDLERFRGEMGVLHDYMYFLIEQELEKTILDLTDLRTGATGLLERLQQTRLCKVRGKAILNDYERLLMFLKKYNNIVSAVETVASLAASAAASTTANAPPEAGGRKKRPDAARMVAEAAKRSGAATDLGRKLPDETLKGLSLITEVFYPNYHELQITPGLSGESPIYRALLKIESLRVPLDRLRMLYGSPTQMDWVLVGSVTHVINPEKDAATPAAHTLPTPRGEPSSLRDAYNVMFQALHSLDDLALLSGSRHEVTISPLAIYRDLRE